MFERWISSSLLQMGKLGSNPLAGLAALGLGGLATPANTGGLNPAGKRNTSSSDHKPASTRQCTVILNLAMKLV
jgi:hypothetical protein